MMYINDLQNAFNLPPVLFADDAYLVTHGSNPNDLSIQINLKLNHALQWTKANKHA